MAFHPLIQQGFFLEISDKGVEYPYDHRFCGEHAVGGAWCPNCEKPLLRLFSFDTRDARLGLPVEAPHALPFVFCWTCNIAHAPFTYAVHPDGGVTLLQYGEGGVSRDFPYARYPEYFPEGRVALLPVTETQQAFMHLLNQHDWFSGLEPPPDWTRPVEPQHQWGGEPILVFGPARRWKPTCPQCRAHMPLLATVADETLGLRGFAGHPYVQVLFTLCAACMILTAKQYVQW